MLRRNKGRIGELFHQFSRARIQMRRSLEGLGENRIFSRRPPAGKALNPLCAYEMQTAQNRGKFARIKGVAAQIFRDYA